MTKGPFLKCFVEPSHVPPSPVPTEVAAVALNSPNGALVGLQITTPCGTQMFFLDVELAKALAKMLLESAGGIVVAQQVPALPRVG